MPWVLTRRSRARYPVRCSYAGRCARCSQLHQLSLGVAREGKLARAAERGTLRSAMGRAGSMRNFSCASTRPAGDPLTVLTVCFCSLPPAPTHRLGPGTEPYSMHTGFNPSKSGYIQQVCPRAHACLRVWPSALEQQLHVEIVSLCHDRL